jgi:regulator of protease activity HflC (stomatin/prohibitin superfamily)
MDVKKIAIWSVSAILGIIAFCLIWGSFFVVEPGEAAVLSKLGKVEQVSYQPGFTVKAPVISDVIRFDVRTRTLKEKTACYTADMQTATIDYTITYNLKKDNVHTLYSLVGTDYEGKKIIPVLNDVIKSNIGRWQAQELVSNRDSARIDVNMALISKIDKRFFENITFQFNNIDYSDAFEKSIEEKVIAGQKAEKAENDTKRIGEEAKQKIIAAEADAKAMTIKAEALAKNKGLTEYEAVQKWDGKLPTYMLGNTIPMINLSK